MELKGPKVQMIPIFSYGSKLKFQLDPDQPIGDIEDQFLDPEPKVIDLDLGDKAIRGLRDMIIVSDDFYQRCVSLKNM